MEAIPQGQPPAGEWVAILGEGEKVVLECSDAKIWAKESYGSITSRHIGSALSSASYAFGPAGKESVATLPPKLPRRNGNVLLVTSDRLLLISNGGVTFGLSTSPKAVERDLNEIRAANQKAGREYSSHKWFPGDIKKYGAVLHYLALASAESRGRALGGRELELKLEVISMVDYLEGVSGAAKWSWGRGAANLKEAIRSYGLRFREEDKVDDVARLLQAQASSIKPIIDSYK